MFCLDISASWAIDLEHIRAVYIVKSELIETLVKYMHDAEITSKPNAKIIDLVKNILTTTSPLLS